MSRARPTGISPYLLRQLVREAQKEVEPPQNQLGIFRDTALHRADCRLAELDRTNPEALGILKAAKRVATARCEG